MIQHMEKFGMWFRWITPIILGVVLTYVASTDAKISKLVDVVQEHSIRLAVMEASRK